MKCKNLCLCRARRAGVCVCLCVSLCVCLRLCECVCLCVRLFVRLCESLERPDPLAQHIQQLMTIVTS